MHSVRRGLFALIMIATLLALPLGAAPTSAAPTLAAPVTVDLLAVGDAGTIPSIPTAHAPEAYLVLSHRANGEFDNNFIQFDLLALPANATVTSATLRLYINIGNQPIDIEVGRADGPWTDTTIDWNSQPAVTWGGPVATATGVGDVTWPVTALVQAWQSGATPNNGVVLRGTSGTGATVLADSKEWGTHPPALEVTYTVPADPGAHPDLGDAPDSTNHHAVNNTAYPGIPGQFPTVWDVPAGQAAGPRHANASGEGILGQYLSREQEADAGPDQDGPNNILRDAAGAIADVADRDRGDDGWRNRNIRFFDCRQQSLAVRVSKSPAATLKKMYLNVWFDGNRDGDWADSSACPDPSGGPAQAGYEWIVQDYMIDMSAIPAGGFLDFSVNTERVLNSTGGKPHWMRFTLSEERAVQPPGGAFPDGRGPHPAGALGAYRFGETEDYLQTPPPPGAPGTLEIQKQVITQGSPVPYAGTVTYQVRLRHVGGTEPIQAQIRDELSYPQHLLPHVDASGGVVYVEATSPGGAAPLHADIDYDNSTSVINQVVSWQGSLAPDAEITLSFDVHIHPFCAANQQTATIRNTAQARPVGGAQISAEASFTAACPGYSPPSIQVTPGQAQLDPIDLTTFQDVPLHYTLTNNHAISVTLGLAQERVNAAQTNAIALPSFQQVVTLGPGESRPIDIILGMEAEETDELASPDVTTVESRLRYCFLSDQDTACPDPTAYPNLSGQGPLTTVNVRPHDLGDAPDSSNHAAAAMTAYPGVPASYPTVFDPATGAIQGPLHAHPRPFHLGQLVSLEAEADLGPDQDPSNNILPAANQPNRDRADDGSRLTPPTASCQATTAEVQVAITPAAWSWFKGQKRPAYLNVWADSNRDGDWADGFTCAAPGGQQADAVEHVIIDFPVDVAALGPGLHTLSVPTGRVAWPAQLAQRPSWVRFTLGERPANKPLTYNGIAYGDGRGFAAPFKTGETEDHLMQPAGGVVDGSPDMAVQLDGRITADGQIAYRIEYRNQGPADAEGAAVTFTPPAQLASVAPATLRAPGIPAADISQTNGKISFRLPAISDGTSNTILLGWDLAALTVARAAPQATSYAASAKVSVAGDSDSANNSASLTLDQPRQKIIVAAQAADGAAWGQRDTTCRTGVTLVGKAEPNAIIAILIGLLVDGKATADASGTFTYQLSGLEPGRQQISAEYDGITSPRDPASGQATGIWLDVSPGMPFDPLSLGFTDSKGRTYHPRTLGWANGADNITVRLRAGETYQIGLDSCLSDPGQSFRITISNAVISLHDDDGDGRYTGSFTYEPAASQAASLAAAGELRIDATSGGVTRSFSAALDTAAGSVADAASGQPIPGVAVSALATGGGLWPAAALGAANPQVTDAGGAYSLGAAGDTSRLAASRSGYQPYTSWDIDGAALDQAISLTPELAGTPDATVYITDSGFDPPLLSVRPGALVEWVNLGLVDHTASGAGWDSGALASGGRYRIRVGQAGASSYADAGGALAEGTILVEGSIVYLPLVRR